MGEKRLDGDKLLAARTGRQTMGSSLIWENVAISLLDVDGPLAEAEREVSALAKENVTIYLPETVNMA